MKLIRLNKIRKKDSSKPAIWATRDKRFIAQIRSNGIHKNLGHFKCEKEAAVAYNKAAIEIHGEYANLNIID
jgi:hypothetical protein